MITTQDVETMPDGPTIRMQEADRALKELSAESVFIVPREAFRNLSMRYTTMILDMTMHHISDQGD
jgi:hypothetical protein